MSLTDSNTVVCYKNYARQTLKMRCNVWLLIAEVERVFARAGKRVREVLGGWPGRMLIGKMTGIPPNAAYWSHMSAVV